MRSVRGGTTICVPLTTTAPGGGFSGRTAPAHMIRLLTEELGGGLQYALHGEALVMGAVLPDNRR